MRFYKVNDWRYDTPDGIYSVRCNKQGEWSTWQHADFYGLPTIFPLIHNETFSTAADAKRAARAAV